MCLFEIVNLCIAWTVREFCCPVKGCDLRQSDTIECFVGVHYRNKVLASKLKTTKYIISEVLSLANLFYCLIL